MTDAATGYGVAISRADVKDLVFSGNLQDIMNRVLATERLSEAARADADAERIRTDAEVDALRRRAEAAAAYAEHPALRLRELETLTALGSNPAARLYLGFDKHVVPEPDGVQG